MPDFDTRIRPESNEPNGPRSPSMAGRVRNRLIAILRLAPIASYALAHSIVVGFWAYVVSEYGVDPNPDLDSSPLRPFLVAAIMIGLTAMMMVPVGAFLGVVDAAARRSSHPLLLALDALLIVLFAPVSIVSVGKLLSYTPCDEYTCVNAFTLDWPTYIGVLIGAELGLVVLMVVSVTDRLRGER